MINNNCVTQYIDCSTYNCLITSNPSKMDKSTCESIVVSSDNY